MQCKILIQRYVRAALCVIGTVLISSGTLSFNSAGAQTGVMGPDMTYHYAGPRINDIDVYDNPSDLQLNLNYARQQAARGDLLTASSTLERLLYLQPNWHSARLFYSAVLYRLDDKQAALRELELLEGRNLTDSQLRTYNDYLSAFEDAPPITAQTTIDGISLSSLQDRSVQTGRALITSAQTDSEEGRADISNATLTPASRGAEWDGRISVALRHDKNAGNAIIDTTLGLSDEPDASSVLQGAVRVSKYINKEASVRLHGSANGQMRNHVDFSESNYATASMRAGATFGGGDLKLNTEYVVDHVSLSSESYLLQHGPRATLSWQASSRMRVYASATSYDQTYEALSIAPNEPLRDGDRNIILVGLTGNVTSSVTVAVTVGTEDKRAIEQSFEYDALRASAQAQYEMQNGNKLKAQVNWRRLNFEPAAASSLFTSNGKETRLNGRLALAVPMTKFVSNTNSSQLVSDMEVEFGLNFNRRDFQTSDPDFSNSGIEAKLVWNF